MNESLQSLHEDVSSGREGGGTSCHKQECPHQVQVRFAQVKEVGDTHPSQLQDRHLLMCLVSFVKFMFFKALLPFWR